MSIATVEDLEVQQADVDTAFLYGTMDEDVYINQPTGFIEQGKADWVCHLLKSLYGTKQAARQWYQKVNGTMTKNGFTECKTDTCVYTRINGQEFSIVALYVDDVFIASRTMDGVKAILKMLKEDYSIKELKIYADDAVLIHQDNQGAIALAKNSVFHQRTKHIDLRYHFIRERVEDKDINICYTPTSEMQADFLTKNLTRPLFEKHVKSIGLIQCHQGKVLDVKNETVIEH